MAWAKLLMPYVKPPKKTVVEKEKSPEEVLWALANEKAFCVADIEKALWGLHYDYRRFLKYDIVPTESWVVYFRENSFANALIAIAMKQ